MKSLDFSQVIVDLDGEQILYQESALTLGRVCIIALLADDPSERIDGEKKFERYEIARRVKAGGELSLDELTLLKTLIGKAWSINVVGPVYDILEK